MRALIFGAKGFIGKYLVETLYNTPEISTIVEVSSKYSSGTSNGNEIVKEGTYSTRQCNIEDYDQVLKLLQDTDAEIVYHLAANPNTKEIGNPVDLTLTNAVGTHNILAALEKLKRKVKFVFASSATVYGNSPNLCKENDILKPTSIYGATKVFNEHLINIYADKGIVDPVICRLIANVGYKATHGVLPDVFKKLRSDSPELELIGQSPGSIKPYMYVRDTVGSMVYLSLSQELGVFNIAPSDSMSIERLANAVMDAINIHKPIKWTGSSWFGDNPYVSVSNQKLIDVLDGPNKYKLKFNLSTQAIRQVALEMLNG